MGLQSTKPSEGISFRWSRLGLKPHSLESCRYVFWTSLIDFTKFDWFWVFNSILHEFDRFGWFYRVWPILTDFEFLTRFYTIYTCWLLKSYDFTSQLAISTTITHAYRSQACVYCKLILNFFSHDCSIWTITFY
jgi:hypothetical protein